MIHLIVGGSGSGKSAYGEKCIMDITADCEDTRFYLATMQVSDEESAKKVERHKELRKGKNFTTVELPCDIQKALDIIPIESTVLLECMSNLVANEMFKDGKVIEKDKVVAHICEGIKALAKHTTNLIVISNNVFEDGIEYDELTKSYIEAIGQVNCFVGSLADRIDEVVVGIPVNIYQR